MKWRRVISAGSLAEELLSHGRYTLTRAEAESRLGSAPAATYMALRRLAQQGWLCMPHAGFYVIVDPQHRPAGTLPPEWFIRELMQYLKRPYYVGLLSAAQMHGAAHHQPQEFQVVIPARRLRPIVSGNVRIHFFGKGPFEKARLIEVRTPTGMMRVSSPETTAWDLVRYRKAGGGLENVSTVLSELAEKLDPIRLRDTVSSHGDVLVAQRLGYILDHVAHRGLTQGIAKWVGGKGPHLRRLNPSVPAEGAPVSRKWSLLVNKQIEAEA